MKIPPDAIIAREKLTDYLLTPREEDDKTRFLNQAGFTQDNPERLEAAIRRLIMSEEAVSDRVDEYGIFYQVRGEIVGPGERSLSVITIWLEEAKMSLELYRRVRLTRDFPDDRLRVGDVARLVDIVEHPADGEKGAVLEVFNVLGESIAVVTVPLSAIEALRPDLVPAARETS
jgi:hypothetical protein